MLGTLWAGDPAAAQGSGEQLIAERRSEESCPAPTLSREVLRFSNSFNLTYLVNKSRAAPTTTPQYSVLQYLVSTGPHSPHLNTLSLSHTSLECVSTEKGKNWVAQLVHCPVPVFTLFLHARRE